MCKAKNEKVEELIKQKSNTRYSQTGGGTRVLNARKDLFCETYNQNMAFCIHCSVFQYLFYSTSIYPLQKTYNAIIKILSRLKSDKAMEKPKIDEKYKKKKDTTNETNA